LLVKRTNKIPARLLKGSNKNKMLLALIVVSANTVKTAMNNPVNSLRTE